MVQPVKNHKNDRNGVGIGHKQIRKEEEFEVSRSSSIYKRILIVDDEPDIAMTLKLGLEAAMTVVTTRTQSSSKYIHIPIL